MLQKGSLFLFRAFGVNVYLHWSWLIVAVLQVYWARSDEAKDFATPHALGFHIAVYLSIFAIVLVHEFGHALACKSVGGRADQIVLWPLGGVAYVQPPQRAGAYLWSIAAGPLVNVILVPLTVAPAVFLHLHGKPSVWTDYLTYIAAINVLLLIFNMLPFFPLDGGQILRALIWFFAGRGLSLYIAAIVGLCGAGLLALGALAMGNMILAVVVGFMALQCWSGIRVGRQLYELERAPRWPLATCPMCRQHPPQGLFWGCRCGARFDTFHTGGRCPSCGSAFESAMCPYCQQSTPIHLWHPQNATYTPVVLTNHEDVKG